MRFRHNPIGLLLLNSAGAVALAVEPRAAQAQVASGQVVDSRTNLPVPGVHVALRADSTNALIDSTTTDRIGAFYLSARPAAPFRLHFSLELTGSWESPPITLGEAETYERQFLVPVMVWLTYMASQVTKPAQPYPRSSWPRYPEQEYRSSTEGRVDMEFVVDTLGNVDLTTARPLRWTHWAFRQSVMEWLPRARFIPAEIEGVKVRQLVQQPYLFKIGK